MKAQVRREATRLLGVTGVLLAGWVVWAALSQRSYDWSGATATAILIALLVRLLQRLRPARELPALAPPSRPLPVVPQFRGVLLIRERVRWAEGDPARFDQAITSLLREFADDRLARRRGLSRARDHVAVARLLGADLLALLDGPPPAAVPSPAWLDDAIGRIEGL